MERIYFDNSYPGQPYNAGDIAGFDETEAQWLVDNAIGRRITEAEAIEIVAGPRPGQVVERQARRGGPKA
jgi:hypothetical protein